MPRRNLRLRVRCPYRCQFYQFSCQKSKMFDTRSLMTTNSWQLTPIFSQFYFQLGTLVLVQCLQFAAAASRAEDRHPDGGKSKSLAEISAQQAEGRLVFQGDSYTINLIPLVITIKVILAIGERKRKTMGTSWRCSKWP